MMSDLGRPRTAREVTDAGKKSYPRSGLAGDMRNTFKDIISILKGLYYGAEKAPGPAIIRKEEDVKKTPKYWKDWRWQVRHVVRDIRTFEQVLGITFDPAERAPRNSRNVRNSSGRAGLLISKCSMPGSLKITKLQNDDGFNED